MKRLMGYIGDSMKRLMGYIAVFTLISQSINVYSAQQRRALGKIQSGSNDVAVGALALADLVEGSNNTALGATAGEGLVMGNNNIYIASPAGSQAEESTTRIGEKNKQKACFISGIYPNISNGEGSRLLTIDENGQIKTISFDALVKQLHGLFGQGKEGISEIG